MAEPQTQQMPAAEERGADRPWVPAVVVLVAMIGFVAGWRCGRGWGRMMGW